MPSATVAMTPAFLPIRSSRDMPGVRGKPAVTITTSDAGDGGVVGAARHDGIEAVHRTRLHQVERLAGGNAAEHVEQRDVAEFLQADQVGERAADVAGADQGDLVAGHWGPRPWGRDDRRRRRRGGQRGRSHERHS